MDCLVQAEPQPEMLKERVSQVQKSLHAIQRAPLPGLLVIVVASMWTCVISKEPSIHGPFSYHLMSFYFVPGVVSC